jgi:hypothetical protein
VFAGIDATAVALLEEVPLIEGQKKSPSEVSFRNTPGDD